MQRLPDGELVLLLESGPELEMEQTMKISK